MPATVSSPLLFFYPEAVLSRRPLSPRSGTNLYSFITEILLRITLILLTRTTSVNEDSKLQLLDCYRNLLECPNRKPTRRVSPMMTKSEITHERARRRLRSSKNSVLHPISPVEVERDAL